MLWFFINIFEQLTSYIYICIELNIMVHEELRRREERLDKTSWIIGGTTTIINDKWAKMQ